MPEKNFVIIWPNGEEETCYSPSSTIEQFIQAGKTYSLDEFAKLTEQALTLASERVREKYGFACSSAQDQLLRIQRTSQAFKEYKSPMVKVTNII